MDIFIFINSILISLGILGIPDYIPGILEDIKNNIPLITGSLLVATFIWRCCIKPEKIVNLAYSKVIKKEERGSIKGVEKLWLGLYDKNDKTNSFLVLLYLMRGHNETNLVSKHLIETACMLPSSFW